MSAFLRPIVARFRSTAAAAIITLACGVSNSAALIVDVVESNLRPGPPTTDAPAVIELGAFAEDVLTFSDRPHQHNGAAFASATGLLSTTGGTIIPLPEYLLDGDYVRFANNARNNAAYQAVVTTNAPADFYLLIDNRANGSASNNTSPNTTDPDLGGPLAWVVDDGWERVDTGISPGSGADYTAVDEAGDGTGPGNGLNQFYSVYRLANLTEVTLKPLGIAGGNMYALVAVPAADSDVPIRNFLPLPAAMLEGEFVLLRWLIADNASIATIDNGVGDILGLTDGEGRGETLAFPDITTDYTLNVTAPSGTDSRTITVEVFAIASFTSANPRISFGGTSNLQWAVSPNFVSVVIDDGMGNSTDVTASTDLSGIGTFGFNPETDTTYTLTVTTPNQVQTATVDVDVRLIQRFTAAPAFFEPGGGSTTLSWQVRPDATLTLTDAGDITSDAGGFGSTSAEVPGTKSFTLTAEAGGQVESQTLTVFARPEGTPFALLDIGATGGSIQAGAANGAQIGAATTGTNNVNLASTDVLSDTGATFSISIDNISATGAVVGVLDWRDRGDSTVPFGPLAEDFVKNNTGVVRVTLGALPAGTYSVVSYHIDSDFAQSSTINIIVTDADRAAVDTGILGNSSFPVGDVIPGIGGLAESDISTRARVFSIRANGTDDVILVFDGRGGSDNETPLNGLFLISADGGTSIDIIAFAYERTTKQSTLTFSSAPGETFRIEASGDLVSWDILDAAFPAAAGGETVFVETNPGDPNDRRFYRIRRN